MDSWTLTVALLVVTSAAALVVGAMALHTKLAAHRIYAFGFLSFVPTLVLAVVVGGYGGHVGILLANSFNALLPLCLAWGFRTANRLRPAFPRRFILWIALWFLAIVAGTFLLDSRPLRSSANSLFVVAMTFEFLLAMRPSRDGTRRELRTAALVLSAGFAAFHLIRVILVLSSPDPGGSLAGGGRAVVFLLVGYLFFNVAWAAMVLALEGAFLLRDLERSNASLRELAATDSLTGLRNRLGLTRASRDERERALRYGEALSLIMFDLDRFKRVNDEYGHAVGDAVLVRTAAIALSLTREPDRVFRWGGEEFMVVAPHTSLEGAKVLAEKLRQAIAAAEYPDVGRVTASFGVTQYSPGEDEDAWFIRADRALYRAKRAGRDRVEAIEADERQPLATINLSWREDMASGSALIDSGHKELFDLSNRLLDLVMSGAPAARTLPEYDRLLAHVIRHFAEEESVLSAVGYPGGSEHRQAHQELVAGAVTFKERFIAGKVDATSLFDFLFGQVVTGHLEEMDTLFFPWTRQKAV